VDDDGKLSPIRKQYAATPFGTYASKAELSDSTNPAPTHRSQGPYAGKAELNVTADPHTYIGKAELSRNRTAEIQIMNYHNFQAKTQRKLHDKDSRWRPFLSEQALDHTKCLPIPIDNVLPSVRVTHISTLPAEHENEHY
jgi:hypothetical protein